MVAPAIGAALIGGGASLLGGLFQQSSAKKAAATQMAFQRDMYGRRYQMTMEDMKTAGLNPILAYKQGVGSAPGGSTYTPQNIGAQAVAGASSASAAARTVRLMDAEVRTQEAKADIAEKEALKADIEAQFYSMGHEFVSWALPKLTASVRSAFEAGKETADMLRNDIIPLIEQWLNMTTAKGIRGSLFPTSTVPVPAALQMQTKGSRRQGPRKLKKKYRPSGNAPAVMY